MFNRLVIADLSHRCPSSRCACVCIVGAIEEKINAIPPHKRLINKKTKCSNQLNDRNNSNARACVRVTDFRPAVTAAGPRARGAAAPLTAWIKLTASQSNYSNAVHVSMHLLAYITIYITIYLCRVVISTEVFVLIVYIHVNLSWLLLLEFCFSSMEAQTCKIIIIIILQNNNNSKINKIKIFVNNL